MRHKLFGLLLALALLPWTAAVAQTFINLTPRPKTMNVYTGTLDLPNAFTISYGDVDEESVNEINRFATSYSDVTGATVTVASGDNTALFKVEKLTGSTTKNEAYTLTINGTGVTVKAKNALGVFYAFQSIKKLLPANVMAGVKDASVTSYTLPRLNITDEPRFEYRGFMLDVARHFFTVEEVKRMIDVMSYYKMNAFHWHLSDDQGWRVEIKKYPKLTSVGSIAPNSRFTDMYELTQYWINKPYGPYYYTQEEIKDVVAYASERHITIIPEIDMPGHFCAALTAYPEFSCTPNGSHVVQSDGGIYSDVMNVANPDAVQFTKDILEELMELFPGEYLHIGGDECPTTAWQNNAQCQAAYKSLGLTDYRQLQSHFIQELAEFVQSKGRKLAIWNEGITASGADLDIMKATGATVYCWTGPEAAAAKAKELGLPNIYTPWGPYYINRKQGNSQFDPPGAGYGTDDVKATYNQTIPDATDYGVQGTFWTEHVSDADYMEWLALPRLIAIAERGWTTEANKDFEDFRKRMSADTVMLNYGNYKYCKYYMIGYTQPTADDSRVMPHANTADKKYYYRLISGGTDATRKDRCIELIGEGSSLLTTYSANGAQVGRLWTNTQAASTASNYDNQWWSIEEDPNNAGKYALVCKAQPDGSVNPNPTATSTAGRWTYDNSTKHYNFQLGTGAYGTKGNNYYYTLSSDQVSGQYLNSSMAGQGLAVNVYSDPTNGAGGQWEFSPMEDYGSNVTPITFDYLEEGKTYAFTNTLDDFTGATLADGGKTTSLQHSADVYAQNAWTVESSTVNADGSQTLNLKNAATSRYIAAIGSYTARLGSAVTVASNVSSPAVTISYVPSTEDYRLKVSDKSLFPIPAGTVNAGSTTSSDGDAAHKQGAGWNIQEVTVVTFTCVDDQGSALGTFTRSLPVGTEVTEAVCPVIKNNTIQTITATGDNAYTLTYKRSAYSVSFNCTDTKGALIETEDVTVPVGESYTVALPSPKYYTLESADTKNGQVLQLTADTTINAVYSTDAITGVKKDGNVVTTIENGKSYLLYDATTAANRSGYRLIQTDNNRINRSTTAEGLQPNAVWTLEGSGKTFKVKNEYTSLYVPLLTRSQSTTASKTGGSFTFALNSDGETWNIKGSNGQYWDGIESGDLVGWDSGTGHPIRISTFYAQPMYTVSVVCLDEDEKTLSETSVLLNAGSLYTLTIPTIDGYTLTSITDNEGYQGIVEGYVTVKANYKKVVDGISNAEIAKPTSTKQGIYDLSGRRIQRVARPGIYIVNGQKTLVK